MKFKLLILSLLISSSLMTLEYGPHEQEAIMTAPWEIFTSAQPQKMKDVFQTEIDNYHVLLSKELERQQMLDELHAIQQAENLQTLVGATKYQCTNGKKPSSLSQRDYIREFSKGPCAPTVFIPGIAASLLQVVIDCPKLFQNDYSTFRACGWTSCDGRNKPDSEYKIWIPRLTFPMSIVKPSDNSRKCWHGLIGMDLDGSGSSIKNLDRKGITIAPIGDTPQTRSKSKGQCGFTAIEELLPLLINISGFHYFKNFKDVFLSAGYKIGVTMQALPYDYRKDYRKNKLNTRFKRVLKELNEITGKKTLIVAHSFGNFQTLNNLWNMSQSEKDTLVARYIALAPPYVGAPKATQGPFGFDRDYCFGLWLTEIGLTPVMFKDTLAKFKGVYDLMLKDTFVKHRSSPWMQEIKKRSDYEAGKVSRPTTGVMSIFPSMTQTCQAGFKTRDKICKIGLFQMEAIGKVKGEQITYASLPGLYSKYSYQQKAKDLLESTREDRFNDFPNPGVQVNIVYSSVIPTLYYYEYNKDPKTFTSQNKSYEPETKKYYYGDGSVLVTSAITPGIKWAYEFDKKSVSGAKPVNFIEVCGDYNRRASVFNSGKSVTKNSYFGVNCGCKGSSLFPSDGKKCAEHAALVEDAKVIELVLNSAVDDQTGYPKGKFVSMSSTTLLSYENSCTMLLG